MSIPGLIYGEMGTGSVLATKTTSSRTFVKGSRGQGFRELCGLTRKDTTRIEERWDDGVSGNEIAQVGVWREEMRQLARVARAKGIGEAGIALQFDADGVGRASGRRLQLLR